MSSRILSATFTVVLFVAAVMPTNTSAATGDSPTGASKLTCQQQINRIQYRAVLLKENKKSEQKRYAVFHKKWQVRIANAAQWVPKDAEDTRDSLYKSDSLHSNTAKEIDTQIASAKKLESLKLDCTPAHKSEITQQLSAIQGIRDGKVVGGNARINQLRKIESAYQTKDFHKQAFHMLERLHGEKAKHPKASHPKLSVK